MEKTQARWVATICSIVVVLGIASFACCVAAEFKRTKKRDIKLDGKLCRLPGSSANGLGMAALMCLFIAQMIGNAVACRGLGLGEKRICFYARKPKIVPLLLVLVSWISFGIVCILLGTASSMNRKQPYGRGWLDGECYIVRDGLFIISAVLVLVNVSLMLGVVAITARKNSPDCRHRVA